MENTGPHHSARSLHSRVTDVTPPAAARVTKPLRISELAEARAPARFMEAFMPRYYFHLTNGRDVLTNHKGVDLPGNAAARTDAVALPRVLKGGVAMPGWEWTGGSWPSSICMERSTRRRSRIA